MRVSPSSLPPFSGRNTACPKCGMSVGPDGRPWRNRWAQEWAIRLTERISGDGDALTGAEDGIRPDPILKARRARESRRLRRARRWPKWRQR